jgi:hypothetical protein
MQNRLVKVLISAGALALILLHALRPDLKVDAITLGLLIVCILPWAASLIQSAEFPGGWKITFRDVEAAARKIAQGPVPEPAVRPASKDITREQIQESDPNLALVGLRIQIEKRLRAVAEAQGLPSRGSASQLLAILRNRGVIDPNTGSGLQDFIALGNRAAHGTKVDPGVAVWARENGPNVLAPLDFLLSKGVEGA